jgi:hypothetical protein
LTDLEFSQRYGIPCISPVRKNPGIPYLQASDRYGMLARDMAFLKLGIASARIREFHICERLIDLEFSQRYGIPCQRYGIPPICAIS